MALNRTNANKLLDELKSYTNIYSLCKDIFSVDSFTPVKVLKSICFFILILLISFVLVNYVSFNILFENIISLNLTISIGLIGLLIGSFSIVMSSTNNDSLYYLILSRDDNNTNKKNTRKKKKKKVSFYRNILLNCMEPLIWFTLLLFISFILKIIYILYSNLNLYIQFSYWIKGIVISILLYVVFSSLKSLEVFLLNMYNMITAHSRFEVMNRFAKSNNLSMKEVIVTLENNLDDNE